MRLRTRIPAMVVGELPAGAPGPAGPQGPAGPAGLQGLQGATGKDGISGRELVVSSPKFVGTGNGAVAYAFCPAGKKAVGGGGETTGAGVAITASFPDGSSCGWGVVAKEMTPTSANWPLFAYAVCATVG